jgi:pimeloyl-ACP methyl ester carboxylesterase
LLALVFVAAAAGAVWEQFARRSARTNFPTGGKAVVVGEADGGARYITIDCRGAGKPVVVLQSGLDGLGSLSWAAVQDRLAATTRVCAYDRAGIMASDEDTRPFTAEHVAEDLHAALDKAGETGPYVMVGHSLGGPYLMTYFGLYPADVAGVVFVDASHPDQIARLRAATGRDIEPGKALAKAASALTWSGLVRALAGHSTPPNLPPTAASVAEPWFPRSLPAMVREMDAVPATLATAGKTRNLGDRPLIVLTRGQAMTPQLLKQTGVTAEQGRRLDATWRAMQDDEATWSTRSSHRVIDGASHYIQLDRPDAVVEAVKEVVGDVRARTPKP